MMIPDKTVDDYIRATELAGLKSDWIILPLNVKIKIRKLVKIKLDNDFLNSTQENGRMVLAFQRNISRGQRLLAYIDGDTLYLKAFVASKDLKDEKSAKIHLLIIGKRWDTFYLNKLIEEVD